MDTQAHILNLLLAPVVLISACGLLCLSATNRLGTILARIRTMHRERVDTHLVLRDDPHFQDIQHMRLEALQSQAHSMLRRAALIRNELFLLYSAILLMLLCSLLLGLSVLFDISRTIGVALFVLGIVSMIAAIAFALFEVACSLRAVRDEHERVKAIDSHHSRDA